MVDLAAASSRTPNGDTVTSAQQTAPAHVHDDDSPRHLDTPQLQHSQPSLSRVSASLHAKLQSFLSEQHDPSSLLYRVQQQARTSLAVVREALTRYQLHELSLSYNGGKDCLVLLILFLASLHPLPERGQLGLSSKSESHSDRKQHSTANANADSDTDLFAVQPQPQTLSQPPITITAMYARPSHPFPSVEAFVDSSAQTYHLSLTRYTTNPPHTTLRDTFASYLQKYPGIKAIFVGTRRTDPHGENLTHFDRTDHGWPDFVRIHPVIDWHYVEIWAFIRHLGIEYCPLYDQGYTSLGGTNDTHPNPRLRVDATMLDGAVKSEFRPAYELIEDEAERLGRY